MALMSESVEVEPSSFKEAVKQPVWIDAMVEEYDSLIKTNVWEVVPRPIDKSMVSSKWFFKVKKVAYGSMEKHKAKFVARGFNEIKGINYDKTFSPVERYSSIISILALSSQMGWKIHQIDVKTTFLNGMIEKEMYNGFETFALCIMCGYIFQIHHILLFYASTFQTILYGSSLGFRFVKKSEIGEDK